MQGQSVFVSSGDWGAAGLNSSCAVGTSLNDSQFLANRLSRCQYIFCLSLSIRVGGVHKEANQRCLRNRLLHDLKPFCGQCTDQKAHAGDIAAGPVEAGNETQPDRISADFEDDRDGCSR